MNRTEKEQMIEDLRSDLAQAMSVVLASHVGMDVNTVGELRSQLRAKGVKYRVVKNTLVKRAIAGTDMEVLGDLFRGPVAIAYSFDDAADPARIIKKFAKDHDKYQVKGGYLDGQKLDEAGVNQLASMPSKEELQAKLLGLFMAVPSKFVRQLNAPMQQFVMVLKAKEEKDAA